MLLQGTPGAVVPQSVPDFERLAGTPEGAATMQAYQALAAGPSDLYQLLPRARDLLSVSGIDFFMLREAMELGVPPARQVWLRGSLDREAILARLSAKGYQPTEEAFPDLDVWGPGGKIDGGMTMNLRLRDPAFPFGGKLGQSWPVVLDGDLLLSSPEEAAIRAAALGTEPSLASPGLVRDMAVAAGMISAQEGGALAQLTLLTPETVGLGGASPNAGAAEPLPSFLLFSLSQVFTATDQWVLLGLGFPDAGAAEAAERILPQRYAQAKLVRTGELLSDRVAGMGGQAQAPFVLHPEGGDAHVVVLPFRLPKEPGKTPYAFRFFTQLLQTRELGWLAAGE